MKSYKSLPPLVEGKIHGYLKFVIDEIIWLKKSLGKIVVLASWWGETDSAQFRPAEIAKDVIRSEQETTIIYAIHTNINLFKEYIKNCVCIELIIVTEEDNTVIGTSQITNLLEIFEFKPFFKYIPVIDNVGNKIGKIHASMKLEHVTQSPFVQSKAYKYEEKQDLDCITLSTTKTFESQKERLTSKESEIYESILKSKRTEFQESLDKINNEVMDKLVAQVVTRAQKLRGAILRETYSEDSSAFNDNSLNGSLQSCIPVDDKVQLSKYFSDKDINTFDESKGLHTLRSISPNLGLIDLASYSCKSHKYHTKKMSNNTPSTKINSLLGNERLLKENLYIKPKGTPQLDNINCIRIYVESFALSPAGYRRVKSSSLSHNDNIFLSATYFVQYDVPFGHVEKREQKSMKENKRVSISSKKQTNQVIYFNHGSIYRTLKLKPCTQYFIKFKIFVRHLNRKSLIELGAGTVHINDIVKSENWSIAHRLVIVNKGIKIGELSVIIELSSDCIRFGKQCIDSITSFKENISIAETELLSADRNEESVSTTEVHSKTSSQVSPTSSKPVNSLTTDINLLVTKDILQYKTEDTDNNRVNVKDQENHLKNKILLHGLIYVEEGRELPELNTYLICRAFWKEDKSKSQICNNTKNPFYQFCQLVPLIHDIDLLDRIKDNYIIIEVYYRNNGVDNLLGLTKLPVHQLYVAYRDPHVLPHLLLSKYPVISVDGWVPINDPVTGQSNGQLLALVALGTAEQIALLELSRGLQRINISQTINCSENFSGCTQHLQNVQQSIKCNVNKLESNMNTYPLDDAQISTINTTGRKICFSNLKSQECQTDVSTIKELKFNEESQDETSNSEYSVLHTLVGRLTQVLNVNKTNIDQIVQTEINFEQKERINMEEPMQINELNCNSSDESDSNSIKQNFHLPMETYRSVGVGAEYDEQGNQQLNLDYDSTVFNSATEIHTKKETTDSAYHDTMFRAVIEIECALHLPKIEKANEIIAPSTYVSFQVNKSDSSKQLNSYMITNVFPHSCNPKWNWKCETKLPTELLLHDEKRLILKIWRILDTNTGMEVNLERDVVIGFSAIDLSILINGFPTVSGWFHIIDFAGKCNGQIKVCITPLDNLLLFGKSMSTVNTVQIPTCNVPQLNWLPSYSNEMYFSDTEKNSIIPIQEENTSAHNENQLNDSIMHIGLEDTSMSFLSLSLKRKLTELDEITKRLESRLRDVTNTAFEDDFENEFDLNEPNSDNENNDYKSTDAMVSLTPTNCDTSICHVSQTCKKLFHNTDTILNENQNISSESEILNRSLELYINGKRMTNSETIKPGSSKILNFHSKQNLSNDNCEVEPHNGHLMQDVRTLEDSFSDYPERGTKTHINYLLDKLSLQFPLQSYSTKTVPMKKNITNSLINLQEDNDVQRSNKCNPKLKVCTVLTQTDNVNSEANIQTSESQTTNSLVSAGSLSNKNLSEVPAQSEISNKMSKLLREELVANENSDTIKCDELTTYLVASNVRHMDLNNIFNPLLYQHLVPDLYYSKVSSEDEAIVQLDNRYAKAFSTSIDNTLNKVQNLVEIHASPSENAELFRMTPSGISENIDDRIDLTILHKSSCNDLLASNSTESTTTISFEKSQIKSTDTEMLEDNYFTLSETAVPILSRQAPDGGNPMEDVKPSNVQQTNKAQNASLVLITDAQCNY